MKKYNKFGLPADDGYDYYQHVFDDNEEPEGELVASITNTKFIPPSMEPDIDYEVHEMTEDQKEVFESLNQEELYEDLEDDFVTLAQEGEDCIENLEDNIESLQKKEEQKKAKKLRRKRLGQKPVKQVVEIKEEDYDEGEEFLDDQEGGDDDDLMKDEEFDEENFQKAMQQYQDCDDEQQQQKELEKNKIDETEFDDILNEHLNDMKVRKNEKNIQNDNFDIKKHANFEVYGNKQEEELYHAHEEEQNFNQDVPDIIKKMKERLDLLDQERNKDQPEPKPQPLPQYNIKRRQKEEREIKRQDKIAEKKALKDKFGDIVVDRKTTVPLKFEEDIALQNYITRTDEEENKLDQENDVKFTEMLEPRPLDFTIATKTFAESKVSENLNMVSEMSRKEINKKIRQSQLLEQSKLLEEEKLKKKLENEKNGIIEDSEEEDEDNDGRIKDVSSIFQKRGKGETKEERKLRKQLVKEFKQQRKENKQQFKNNFNDIQKKQNTKLTSQGQNQNNLRGVAVQKL